MDAIDAIDDSVIDVVDTIAVIDARLMWLIAVVDARLMWLIVIDVINCDCRHWWDCV